MKEFQVIGYSIEELAKPRDEQEPVFLASYFAITSSAALRMAEIDAGLEGVSSSIHGFEIKLLDVLPDGANK